VDLTADLATERAARERAERERELFAGRLAPPSAGKEET